jgi:hypothetical protein
MTLNNNRRYSIEFNFTSIGPNIAGHLSAADRNPVLRPPVSWHNPNQSK